ncbi:hypothetical protein M405DRAFT_892189 [Rhizopogon salebrosus TDB-379]|nr:hypothetical protein M405DRAFT_892189 [Rhizopogon salebrosus TDB-379]
MRHVNVCLLPAEILRDIFAAIRKDSDFRATTATLARTCRTLKEPALDALWKNIIGFKPLLSCLPNGIVVRTSKRKQLVNESLLHPLFTEEWKTFRQYARRIHFLIIHDSELDGITDRVVQALISAPTPLLPNLHSLQWLDDRECFFPLLRALLVPTITSMRLGSGLYYDCWDPSFVKSALLASLGTRCPSIRTLEVCPYGADSEESSDAVSEAICGWRKLVHLKTGVLNARALTHLASLASLKSLRFMSYDFEFADDRPNTIPIFTSQLDAVSVAAPSYFLLTRCLRNIRFFSCRSAELLIGSPGEPQLPYDPDIPEFIVSFSECFSPVLEELLVNVEFSHEDLDDHPLSFGFDVIAPLLSFRRLTTLDINWFCTTDVNDDAFKKMAQSWPQLEKFCFGVASAMLASPSVTFIGLIYLIQYCRHLRNVTMYFRACPIDIKREPFSKIVPNEKIEVGDSPIVDPIAVACQLHILLPDLIEVTHNYWDWVPVPPSIVAFNHEWDKVNEYLEVLTKSAEMGEMIGELSDSEGTR